MRPTRCTAPILALALLVAGLCSVAVFAARTEVSFGFFHSSLSPHGSWYESPDHGRVWQPSGIPSGWHPYHRGHWIYTEVGWTWVSDYAWGAIPYHFGTWALDPALGWVWVPGYVWAPSWVVFRTGPSYAGWSPVPPSFAVGVSRGLTDLDADHFVFVRGDDFLAPEIHSHALPAARARAIFHDTRLESSMSIEDGVVANRGIDVERVERFVQRPVEREPLVGVPSVALLRDAGGAGRSEVRVIGPAPR